MLKTSSVSDELFGRSADQAGLGYDVLETVHTATLVSEVLLGLAPLLLLCLHCNLYHVAFHFWLSLAQYINRITLFYAGVVRRIEVAVRHSLTG